MLNFLLENLDYAPRRVFVAISALCVGLLAFGLYLQHVVGLEPCPMCIVQRYALVGVALWAGIAAAGRQKPLHIGGALLVLITSGFGAFVAARQSWLQWYPPEVVSCGRDFYGMIETFPLKRALPMIFRGACGGVGAAAEEARGEILRGAGAEFAAEGSGDGGDAEAGDAGGI